MSVFGMACAVMAVLARLPVPAQKVVEVCAQVKPLLAVLAARGCPLPRVAQDSLRRAAAVGDSKRVDRSLREFALLEIHINPESRVKVTRGPAKAELTPGREALFLLRIVNEGGVTAPLRLAGPNLVPKEADAKSAHRSQWLSARLLSADKPGSAPVLNGGPLEYVVLVLSTKETGLREALLAFDVGQGTQDLGFRGECPVLFRCRSAKKP